MNEKAIAAALEPILDDLIALEKRLDAVQLMPGPTGPTGTGIDAPHYVSGAVYRKGSIVSANIGQHFLALKDTASSPDEPDHWQRIGNGGFRHRGAFKADTAYENGDLFRRDFGTFAVVNGEALLLAARGDKGRQGEQGLPGVRGEKGETGRDGATIIAAQVQGFKLVLVQEHADGSVDHIEADFGPAFQVALDEALRGVTV